MLSTDLYNKVLLEPAKKGCNKLLIISGYATSAMAFHHLSDLKKINPDFEVHLILGMCAQDGLSKSNHKGFQKLMDDDFSDKFTCSYVPNCPPVHSKAYIWLKDNMLSKAFTGSANYTQTAFGKAQRELMSECSAKEAYDYFGSFSAETIYCNHQDAETLVTVYRDQTYDRLRQQKKLVEDKLPVAPNGVVLEGLPFERLSFLDNNGNLPERSGLNWGQRPEEHREPNQAYIRIPLAVGNSGFFPEKGVNFTVYTDNDKVLICARKQANGKGIQTPHNNSIMGEYFRTRLGVPLGAKVTKKHLLVYGRTDVTFYKIDDETYYMDFSKPIK
ncbi:MAG: restriction endonuclease PLD domain-containing protein [Candidatus Bathyarchaeia archaeon]|jgi:hypothetical protein